MNQNPYLNLSEKKILIAGAGVTGTAAARALTKRGAEIVLVDEKVAHNSEFSLLKPEDVAMKEFDTLLTVRKLLLQLVRLATRTKNCLNW